MAKAKQPFAIELPSDWEDQTTYVFYGPKVDEQQHFLQMIITRHLQAEDIEEFAEDQTEPILNSMEGIEVLKDEEISGGSYPVWEFVYKWVPSENAVVIQKYVFVIRGDWGYTFSIQFSKKSYKKLSQQVTDIIEQLLPGTYEEED